MRTTMIRLALLATVATTPALAQTTPAPTRNASPTTEGTRPGTAVVPEVASPVAPGSGATSANRPNEGQSAVRLDSGTRTVDAPAPGANSFTEGQARSRIEAAGYTDISELQKDDQGIWRGKAQRGGQQVGVALDYQGSVATVR